MKLTERQLRRMIREENEKEVAVNYLVGQLTKLATLPKYKRTFLRDRLTDHARDLLSRHQGRMAGAHPNFFEESISDAVDIVLDDLEIVRK